MAGIGPRAAPNGASGKLPTYITIKKDQRDFVREGEGAVTSAGRYP